MFYPIFKDDCYYREIDWGRNIVQLKDLRKILVHSVVFSMNSVVRTNLLRTREFGSEVILTCLPRNKTFRETDLDRLFAINCDH